jgi:thiol-disulfide isomerase/thioredoxin
MKRLLPAAFAVTLAVVQIPSLLAQDVGMKLFEGSWDQVVAEAKRQNKPIYLDAYASWCGPCKVLKREIFTRPDVGAYFNENYIAVSIDMEKGEGIELAKKYNVRAYPTHLYFDPDGTIVHRAVGGAGGDEFAKGFIELARQARDPNEQIYTLQRRFEKGEREPGLLRRLALGAVAASMEEADYYELEYIRTQDTEEEILSDENWMVLKSLADGPDSPAFGQLMRNRKKIAEKRGDAAVTAVLVRVAVNKLGRMEGEKRYYDELVRRGDSIFHATTSAEDIHTIGSMVVGHYQQTENWEKFAAAAVRYVELGNVTDPSALNEIAWAFYEHVDDKAMLAKAEKWAEKAAKAMETYAIVDTHASLLFKLGRKKEAQKVAERAIELGKTAGDDYAATEELLAKIKAM